MKVEHRTEKELVEHIVKGEEWAFKRVFLAYYEPLCDFCWRYVKSKAVSEDLVQEVFAKMWNLRRTLDPDRSIRIYMYQAVKHKALDYLDHQEVVRRFETSYRYENNHFEKQEGVLQNDEAFIEAAREAIDNLPSRAQQVYVLHREDGLTYNEIAEIMEISRKTVESQISRALSILRKELRNAFPDRVTDRTIARIFSMRSTGTR